MAQLPDEELAVLLGGQPNTGVANTFGYGNLPEYGVPNMMTADGPAGLRISPECGVCTTAWPCSTLLACTWDPMLAEKVGEAGGAEVKENNIGAWLTPAVLFIVLSAGPPIRGHHTLKAPFSPEDIRERKQYRSLADSGCQYTQKSSLRKKF